MVLVLSTLKERKLSCIKSLLKLVPGSLCKTSGGPYLINRSSTSALATVVAVLSYNGTITTYLLHRSELTRRYLALDFEAKVTGPKMSAGVTLNEFKTWVGCSSPSRIFPANERAAQQSHFAICPSTLDIMTSYQNLCLFLARVFSTAKWPSPVGASSN